MAKVRRNKVSERWRLAVQNGATGEVRRCNSETVFRNGRVCHKTEQISRCAAIEVSRQDRQHLQAVKRFDNWKSLLDCKEVDKYFRFEGGVPKYKRNPRDKYAPNLKTETAILFVNFGARIVDDGTTRRVYFGEYLAGSVTFGVLSTLRKSGIVTGTRLPGSHVYEWRAVNA